MTWMQLKHPKLYPFIFAIPNGGKRNVVVAKKLKAEGVKAGIPDLFFSYPKGKYHGMFIEMKYGKNKQTKAQKEYFELLQAVNYKCVVCYNLDEFILEIENYLRNNE